MHAWSRLHLTLSCLLLGCNVLYVVSHEAAIEVRSDWTDLPKALERDIQVLIHVRSAFDWHATLEQQLRVLLFSGLWDHASAVHVHFSQQPAASGGGDGGGGGHTALLLNETYGSKLIITQSEKAACWGQLPPNCIRTRLAAHTRILYLSIGDDSDAAGRTPQGSSTATATAAAARSASWQAFSEFLLVGHWRACLCLLGQLYDVVNVCLQAGAWPSGLPGHFWTTGAWWLQLEEWRVGDSLQAHLLTGMMDPTTRSRVGSLVADAQVTERPVLPAAYERLADWTIVQAAGCQSLL